MLHRLNRRQFFKVAAAAAATAALPDRSVWALDRTMLRGGDTVDFDQMLLREMLEQKFRLERAILANKYDVVRVDDEIMWLPASPEYSPETGLYEVGVMRGQCGTTPVDHDETDAEIQVLGGPVVGERYNYPQILDRKMRNIRDQFTFVVQAEQSVFRITGVRRT